MASLIKTVCDCWYIIDNRLRVMNECWLKNKPLDILIPLDESRLRIRSAMNQQTWPIRIKMNVLNQSMIDVDLFGARVTDQRVVLGVKLVNPLPSKRKRVVRPPASRLSTVSSSSSMTMDDRLTERLVFRRLNFDLIKSFLNSVASPNGWVVPDFNVGEIDSVIDEITAAIPSHLQSEFTEAVSDCNFSGVSELLSCSVFGNINVCSKNPLAWCPEMLISAYRLLLHMALSSAEGYGLIHRLDEARKTWVFRRLEQPSNCFVSLSFALTSVSIAIKNKWRVDSFLRKLFVDSIKTSSRFPQTRFAQYWLCILWASLAHVGRNYEESREVLESLMNVLEDESKVAPMSLTVCLLKRVTLKDLSIVLDRDFVEKMTENENILRLLFS
jgi:hypothetical protein